MLHRKRMKKLIFLLAFIPMVGMTQTKEMKSEDFTAKPSEPTKPIAFVADGKIVVNDTAAYIITSWQEMTRLTEELDAAEMVLEYLSPEGVIINKQRFNVAIRNYRETKEKGKKRSP